MPGDTYNIGLTVPALFKAHEDRYQEAQEVIAHLRAENEALLAVNSRLLSHATVIDSIVQDAMRWRYARDNLDIGKVHYDPQGGCFCEFEPFDAATIDAAIKG